MKLHTMHMEINSGDFILYNLPELFQRCEKLENLTVRIYLFTYSFYELQFTLTLLKDGYDGTCEPEL